MPEIEVGTVLTIEGIEVCNEGVGVGFHEIKSVIHPVLGIPCLYNLNYFRELQPPMIIKISDLLPEEITA